VRKREREKVQRERKREQNIRQRIATTVTAAHQFICRNMYDSVYIKSQKASSSLSRLTKIASWDRCGDEKSFQESAARKIWRRRHKILRLKDQSKTVEKNVTASIQ